MHIKLNRINQAVALEASNQTGQRVLIDGSEQVGGEGLGLRPMELLLSALVACSSIDVLVIMKKKRIELRHYEVEVDGERSEEVPSAFKNIHLKVIIGAEDPVDEVAKAMSLSLEKYCSVHASLNPEIEVTFEINQL